jgi:hypothetical protein
MSADADPVQALRRGIFCFDGRLSTGKTRCDGDDCLIDRSLDGLLLNDLDRIGMLFSRFVLASLSVFCLCRSSTNAAR